MGSAKDLLFGSGSKWNADTKIDRRAHAASLITGRSSKHNGEQRQANVDRRRDQRQERRAAAKAESSGLCSAILLASSLAAAGLAANVARAKGWA